MKTILIALFGLVLASSLFGAPLQRDLGRGLVYMRVARVPDDLPQHSQAPAIVLDLRSASGSSIKDWLAIYAAPQTPIFVLANVATQKSLRDSVREVPGSITIGVPEGDFIPDIAVTISADEDQRAYEALPETEDLATLLYPATHKERYDEAAMVREHEITIVAPDTDADGDATTVTPAPQLIDQTLLCAVQIHRGWLVLRSR